MPFTIIPGTFHVVNYSPDGDSIRFQPEDQALVRSLQFGNRARFNARGHVQLRIEAIDTLETHFNPPGGGNGALHQPTELARGATQVLMDFLGIQNVVWDQSHRNVIDADDGTPGYVLARSVERNGRPVAFVFAGDAPGEAGADFRLEVDHLRQSYNWLAVRDGLAYATFYKGLFSDLREELSVTAQQARQAGVGVYAADGTQAGFDATSLQVITDQVPIMPKLFRRLSDYMVNTGSAVGFKESLAQAQEPVLHLPTSNFTHFDTFIAQAAGSNRISLTCDPEDLVFDETIPQPGPVFAAVFNPAGGVGV